MAGKERDPLIEELRKEVARLTRELEAMRRRQQAQEERIQKLEGPEPRRGPRPPTLQTPPFPRLETPETPEGWPPLESK